MAIPILLVVVYEAPKPLAVCRHFRLLFFWFEFAANQLLLNLPVVVRTLYMPRKRQNPVHLTPFIETLIWTTLTSSVTFIQMVTEHAVNKGALGC